MSNSNGRKGKADEREGSYAVNTWDDLIMNNNAPKNVKVLLSKKKMGSFGYAWFRDQIRIVKSFDAALMEDRFANIGAFEESDVIIPMKC